MNPDANETPGLGLPSPLVPHSGPDQVGAGQPGLPALQDPQAPAAIPQPASFQDTGGSDDALDEEWVNKAKAIIDGTRNDPFLESKELSKIKANYLKNRYNKDIKLSEHN